MMVIQLTLNELISSSKSASNRLINFEDLTVDEQAVEKSHIRLAEPAIFIVLIHRRMPGNHEMKKGYSTFRLKNPSKST